MEYGLFLAKALTILAAIVVAVIVIASAIMRTRIRGDEGRIEVRKLNGRFEAMREALMAATLDEREYKRWRKAERKAAKARQKRGTAPPRQSGTAPEDTARKAPRRVFVLGFHGDIRALAVRNLREEISALLTFAEAEDQVVVRLESSGGMVHAYGLAAAQLARIRDRGIPLTVCVDKVAASGGYLMACVANHVVAAPFAMVGSIGVLAQIPNFHRLLKKHDIDYELLTAGQYKRTLSVFGHNTDAGRQKFTEELEDTHALFREYVQRYRPTLDVTAVATGEVWFGERALALGLIDALGTSDSLLQEAARESEVFELRHVEQRSIGERFGLVVEGAIRRGVEQALDGLSEPGRHLH